MLVFLIPLKAKASASDWHRVSQLCERTLRSASNQTSSNFRIILSCEDLPEMQFTHPQLIIEQGTYPTVDQSCKQSQSLDKVYKLAKASSRAREFAPCHVMVLDADDLVSNRLAEFVDRHQEEDGWRIDAGWMYQEGSRFICKHPRLSTICGSTFIIRCLPEDLPKEPKKGDLLLTAHISHTELSDFLARQGRPLTALPFPGTIYSADHGENWTDGYFFQRRSWRLYLKRLRRMRVLTKRVRREFGLSRLK